MDKSPYRGLRFSSQNLQGGLYTHIAPVLGNIRPQYIQWLIKQDLSVLGSIVCHQCPIWCEHICLHLPRRTHKVVKPSKLPCLESVVNVWVFYCLHLKHYKFYENTSWFFFLVLCSYPLWCEAYIWQITFEESRCCKSVYNITFL